VNRSAMACSVSEANRTCEWGHDGGTYPSDQGSLAEVVQGCPSWFVDGAVSTIGRKTGLGGGGVAT
jgi:hypothetical protein